MLIYFIVFFIVLMNTYFIAKMKKKNNKLYIVLLVINVIILACFAGLRDDTVGYDIGSYIEKPFEWASNMKFHEFLDRNDLEIGFRTLIYLTTLTSDDYHILLIIIQIIIISCVYYYGLKSEKNILFIIFIYLMIFFNDTMSFMRESMAYCILLVSMVQLKEKKYLKALIIFFIALSFHNTAIIIPVIYAIYCINNNIENRKNKQLFNIIIFSSIILGALFYKQIIYVLCYFIKILPEKYYLYFSSKYYGTNNVYTFKLIFDCIIIIYEYYLLKIKKDNNMTYLLFALISLVLNIMSYKLGNLIRLSYYFSIVALLDTLPELHIVLKKDKFNKGLGTILMVSLLIFYWIYIYGNGATVPYTSKILHII